MKKVFVIVLICLIGVYAIYAVFKFLERKENFRSMTPLSSQKLTSDVWVLKNDFVNAYIIKANDSNLIAIDAGLSENGMVAEMRMLGIDPTDVRWVFLTHTDYDHAGGITAFKKAIVYILDKEVEMINGSVVRAPFMKNELPVPFTEVHDNEVVMCDTIAVKPIALQGHTRGHSAYLVKNRHLFTGDAIRIKNNKASVFIPSFNMNTAELKTSIHKLLDYSDHGKTIYTSHFGYGDANVILQVR